MTKIYNQTIKVVRRGGGLEKHELFMRELKKIQKLDFFTAPLSFAKQIGHMYFKTLNFFQNIRYVVVFTFWLGCMSKHNKVLHNNTLNSIVCAKFCESRELCVNKSLAVCQFEWKNVPKCFCSLKFHRVAPAYIWQIQLWCPRSKWNMGETSSFLA